MRDYKHLAYRPAAEESFGQALCGVLFIAGILAALYVLGVMFGLE